MFRTKIPVINDIIDYAVFIWYIETSNRGDLAMDGWVLIL